MTDDERTRRESDTERDQYTVHHDWQNDDELTVTITCAVATVKDVSVSDVGPLSESVNPDALNELFAPRTRESPRRDVRIEFSLDGCRVSADSDGQVVIRDADL